MILHSERYFVYTLELCKYIIIPLFLLYGEDLKYFLLQGIFFGGLDPSLRTVVWPFLLHCYPSQSTYDEREQIQALRRQEYLNIL